MNARFETARLKMRRTTAALDAEALHEGYRDEELMRFWSSAPHAALARTEEYLQNAESDVDWRAWTVIRRDTGAIIGTMSESERRSGVHEIGYLFVRAHWGQGFAAEALAALFNRLFNDGARRLFADTDPENARSIALLQKLGFTLEGRLRAEWETHIGVRDALIWGLLADEWRARASR